jgi:formate C-acetyltransferase
MELKKEDEFFGWMFFNNSNIYDDKLFSDCVVDEKTQSIINAPFSHGSITTVDKAHTLVDYRYILENGLSSYREKIESKMLEYPDDEYLTAMMDELVAIEKLVLRMQLAAENNPNGCEKASKIKAALEQVPFYPARDFLEAIQSVWIIHFLLPVAEHAYYSISLGKFDKYIYPFYKKSMAEGMTREEAKRILHNFYKLLNSYSDGACLLNVGSEYNELSELIIECQRDFSMPAPILGARISESTPDNIWNMLIDEKLFSRGQPTFYGENSCVAALVEKGVTRDHALGFSNNSCMGIGLAGEEFNSMWGCVFSTSAALEAALNRGTLLHKNDVVPGIGDVRSLDDLYDALEKSATYLLDICIASYEKRAYLSEKTDPDPFVSLLTEGCIEKRCDRISGAKYHNVTVECMGMINVSDGICAIDNLVFKNKKYSLEELSEAVKNNFVGYEEIRDDILKCNKYGQNSDADSYAIAVAEILQRVIRKKDHANRRHSPSLHTLTANVDYGLNWGAGYDGRLAHEPFAKNAAPSDHVRRKEPTSLILSAAKLPQHTFFGGQPIDINFSADIIRNHKKEIAALISTYFQLGGLQLQVNSMTSDLLKDAVNHPEKYSDLVVRIGGYSCYFNWLSEQVKREFIMRTEIEEKTV